MHGGRYLDTSAVSQPSPSEPRGYSGAPGRGREFPSCTLSLRIKACCWLAVTAFSFASVGTVVLAPELSKS